MIKAVIFDLDGTLIDSMGVWDKISRDCLATRGIDAPNNIGTIVKNMSFQESAEYYIKTFSLPTTPEKLIQEWNQSVYHEYAYQIEVKKGVPDFITNLVKRGLKLGVATATERTLTELVLQRNGIQSYFETVITISEVGKGKDHPDIFLKIARQFGVKPSECIVFEDSLHAVRGAQKAGMKVWAVYDYYSAHERKELKEIADGYIQSFELLRDSQIAELLK